MYAANVLSSCRALTLASLHGLSLRVLTATIVISLLELVRFYTVYTFMAHLLIV
jgi:hypothetical protein